MPKARRTTAWRSSGERADRLRELLAQRRVVAAPCGARDDADPLLLVEQRLALLLDDDAAEDRRRAGGRRGGARRPGWPVERRSSLRPTLALPARVNRPDQSAAPAIAPSQPSVAELLEVGEARDAAGGDDGEPARLDDASEQLEVGAGERAVAARVRDEEAVDAGLGAAGRELLRGELGDVRPAAERDLAVLGVDRDDEALAEAGRRLLRGSRAPRRRCRPSRARRPRGGPSRSPRASGSRRRPGAGRRAPPPTTRATSCSVGAPAKAPSRSTRWSQRAPSPAKRRAAASGSPPSIVTRSRTPSARRTQRPSRTSSAG